MGVESRKMVRQVIGNSWYFDVGSTFSRGETEDGFIVFQSPTMQIWAVVYVELPRDPLEAIESVVGSGDEFGSRLTLQPAQPKSACRAYVRWEEQTWRLFVIVACGGQAANVEFECNEYATMTDAMRISQSIRCECV